MHRLAWGSLALLFALLAPLATAGPFTGDAVVPCNELEPRHGGDGLVLPACPVAIRPGIRSSNMCTLNFVFTDGTDLYIGAAGHCTFVGERLGVTGIPGKLGTTVVRASGLANGEGDWALVKIDPEHRDKVDPTMCRFGGPTHGPLGTAVRTPQPGEIALHYGHGSQTESTEELHGRAGPVVFPVLSKAYFNFAGTASGGDSGSPVVLATGEAAGILIGVGPLPPNTAMVPNLVFAAKLELAIDAFEMALGKDLELVTGTTLV